MIDVLVLESGKSLGQLVPALVIQTLVTLVPGLANLYLKYGLLGVSFPLGEVPEVDQHLLRLGGGGHGHLGLVLSMNLL